MQNSVCFPNKNQTRIAERTCNCDILLFGLLRLVAGGRVISVTPLDVVPGPRQQHSNLFSMVQIIIFTLYSFINNTNTFVSSINNFFTYKHNIDSTLVTINEVVLHWVELLLGSVTVCEPDSHHLGIQPTTYANSAL